MATTTERHRKHRKHRDRRGREQRRRSAAARARQPNLVKWYRRSKSPIDPREFELRLDLLRGRDLGIVPLGNVTETFDWSDEEAMLTGSATFRRPDPHDKSSLPVARNLQIRCRVSTGGGWRELWRMRCGEPTIDIDSEGVKVTVELRDDLDLVRRGRRRYVYRETKRRKHGWFGHDALVDAAKRDGIRLGQIAKCSKRRKKISVTGSFLDLARNIYEHENHETGRRFVLRMRNGRFEVVPYKRNRIMHVFSDAIESASVVAKPAFAKPVTVIVAKARIGKGDDARKITYTHSHRRMVQKYGWVQKEQNYGKVATFGELRRTVKRDLADQYLVKKTATVEIPGLPFIRRGEGEQLLLRTEGFRDEESFVWVTGVRHSVSSERYTTSVDVTRDDPFVKFERKREKDAREAARKRRKRKRGDHG